MTTFTLNNKTYTTDTETLEVLHSIMPSAKASGDSSAVIAVVELGKATGRIVEVSFTPTIAQSAEALCQVRANASELDINLFLCAIERHYGTEHMKAAHKLAGEIAEAKHAAERMAA